MIDLLDSIEISFTWFFILLIAAFIAGYIDSIAGAGGMIQALSLLAAGVPAINTLAISKVAGLAGVITAGAKYSLNKKVNWGIAKACAIPAFILSTIGASLVIYLSETFIIVMILLCIPVAFLCMFGQHIVYNEKDETTNKLKSISCLSPVAFYDGLIGPGTGTYLAIISNKYLNMNYLRATALAKIINFFSNFASVIVFIFAGKILWIIAIPMAVANFAGAYIGSHYAIKNGEGFIKKVMIIMLIVMMLVNIVKLFM